MADALDDMFEAFAAVGITPGMDTSEMTDEEKVELLTKAASGPEGDDIEKTVEKALSTVEEQGTDYSRMYAAMLHADLVYSAESAFSDLANYLEILEEIKKNLNDLVVVSSPGDAPTRWAANVVLRSGHIPEGAANEIQAYFSYEHKTNPAYTEFYSLYQNELEAKKISQQAGKIEKDNVIEAHKASELLRQFISESPENFEAILTILKKYGMIIPELNSQMLAAAGEQLWHAYGNLEQSMNQLNSQSRVNPELVGAFTSIKTDINQAWSQALAAHNYTPNQYPTPSSVEGTDVYNPLMTNFYQNYTQINEEGINHLTTATSIAQQYDVELQKEFQKQITDMQSLLKINPVKS
jgi:hypothetical protein